MIFNRTELTAILKAGHCIVSADGVTRPKELAIIFLEINNFNVSEDDYLDLLHLADSMDAGTMITILSRLSEDEKKYVCGFLAAIMMSDGDIDESEIKLWQFISMLCSFPGISIGDAINYWRGEEEPDKETDTVSPVIDALLQGSNNPIGHHYEFKSSDHIRYENGVDVSGHNYNCHRTIKIQKDIKGRKGYTVSVLNDDGVHPLWGNNVQIAPKPMRIVSSTYDKIELKGCGEDDFGTSFADYGLTLIRDESVITSCILHMFDRHVDIEYLK